MEPSTFGPLKTKVTHLEVKIRFRTFDRVSSMYTYGVAMRGGPLAMRFQLVTVVKM